MPLLCGPQNSRFTLTGTPCPHVDLAIPSDAQTLGEAISDYEQHFQVTISPMLEPLDGDPTNVGKYFKYRTPGAQDWSAVDIHVLRGKDELCPKQDLSFPLQSDDLVEIGQLIC